jgi:TatD DNase family protein
MNLPRQGDYIDIHSHGAKPAPGIFIVENLMAHEKEVPENIPGVAFTAGIHPWYLNENNHDQLIRFILTVADRPCLIAIGEAGFDKLKGPSAELQKKTFEEQIIIANDKKKPVIIHCVRAWDELLSTHKKLKPSTLWLIHGFRGKKELALRLISRGMFLSFWFDFVVRAESTDLLRSLPTDRIFLETDGADVDIRDIYNKVATDLDISVDDLKLIISDNFNSFFHPPAL